MNFKHKLTLILSFIALCCFDAQNIEIKAKSDFEGEVYVDIINNTKHKQVLYFDALNLNFGCSENDIDRYSYLRGNLCLKIPSNWHILEQLTFIQGVQLYGDDYKQSLKNYIASSKIVLEPFEIRRFRFNIYKQKNYSLGKNTKLFKLVSKIVFHEFEIKGESIKVKDTIESNEFLLKLRLFKKM